MRFYRYGSLEELNALLRLYNVKARIVWENQALKRAKGLMYHTLDEKGAQIGLSFKSSSFASRPTLKKLEEKFSLNRSLQQEAARRVISNIDWTFILRPIGWEGLQKSLIRENILTILEKDRTGEWRNIFYLDLRTRWVFNGAAIGDRYDSQSIRARCISEEQEQLQESLKLKQLHRLRHSLF